MKTRIMSIACLSCIACLSPALSGCIEENPAIVLKGFLDPTSGDCKNPSAASAFISKGWYDSNKTSQYTGFLHVQNNSMTESPWQSSGSSTGTGTTHVETDTSRNAIFVDNINIDCYEINGDKDACIGAKRIKKSAGNFIVTAQGLANIPVSFSLEDLAEWDIATEATLKISLSYHDSGVIKNKKSSSIYFTLNKLDGGFQTKCTADEATPPSECAHWGQDISWKCDEK